MRPDPAPSLDAPPGARGPVRSGRAFVILAVLGTAAWLTFLLVGSPRLMERFGVGNASPPFPTPTAGAVTAPLAHGEGWTATGIWDHGGVCAEVVFAEGPTTRSCAQQEGLRPLWGFDVPDTPVPLLVVGASPDVDELVLTLDDGEEVTAPVLGSDVLPAGFAIVEIPPGSTVATVAALGLGDGTELVEALCGQPGADVGGIRLDGPALLGGGCYVPRSDQ